MAQVARHLAAIAGLLFSLVLPAQPPALPPEAVAAEAERRLDDALAIYGKMVERDPARADVWLRMADIYSAMNQPGEAARALAGAARARPSDHALHARLSQTLAMDNQSAAALAAIRKAVSLKPDQTEYLKAQAELAAWAGDPALAEQSYRELLQRAPDLAALLEIGRLQARNGRLDDAVASYRKYAADHPKDHAVLLELAGVQMYRGNFAAARDLLDRYREQVGTTFEYRRAEADLLARGGHPGAALAQLPGLMKEQPSNYELHLTRSLALHTGRRPGPALQSLADLEKLGPQRPETRGMHLQVETPQRPAVALFGNYYGDSNGLSQRRGGIRGGVQLSPAVRLSVTGERIDTEADAASGLQTVGGESSLRVDHAQLGLSWQISPAVALDLAGGSYRPDTGDAVTDYRVGLRLWPADSLDLRLTREHEPVLVSPLAISLGVKRDRNRLALEWRAGYAATFAADFSLDDFDDGNRAQDLVLGPRLAIARTERHNLDLGVRGQWLRYDSNPGRGYYAPEDFHRYWMTAFYYLKASDNAGVGVALGYGQERDEALDPDSRWSGDVAIEGIFGVFGNWQLRVQAGYGGRVDSAAFASGDYHGRSAGLELTRRF